jgi:hypothetical protein
MQLNRSTFITLLSLVATSLAVDTRYDTAYNNAEQSLNTVACSNGANGLIL